MRHERETGLDEGRAGTQPAPVRAPEPAFLAGAHEAEAGARLAVELVVAQPARAYEDRGEHGIAREYRKCHAIDRDLDLRPVRLG